MAEKNEDSSVSLVAHIVCNVKEDLQNIAHQAQNTVSKTFGGIKTAIEASISTPAKKAAQNISKTTAGMRKEIQSLGQSAQSMVTPAVENARLKVQQLERELTAVNEQLDAMRDKKRGELSMFYGDNTKGLNAAVESAVSKDKDYAKLLAKSDKINNKLMAADDKLNLARRNAAQKTAQEQIKAAQKAAQESQRQAMRDMQATQRAERQKRKEYQKTLRRLTSGFSGGVRGITKGISRQVSGVVKGIGQKVSRLTRSIRSAFKSAIFMAGLYAAFRGLRDLMGELIDRNKQLKTSLSQIKINLLAAFMPIVNFVMPAVTALAQGLAYVTKKIAEFTATFFGGTYKASTELVESLKNAQKELKKTAQLASIDEINNLGDNSEAVDTGLDFGALDQGYGDPDQIVQNIKDRLNQIAEQIPAFIAAVLKKVADAAPQFVQAASDIINTFLRSLNDHWDEISNAGIKIINSLIDGLISMAPQLAVAASNLCVTLITTIVTAAPKLLEAGLLFITKFLEGLDKELPKLVPKIQNAIERMIAAMIYYLPQILNTGISIVTQLLNGIASMAPRLVPQAVQLVMTLVQTILNNLPQMLQAGVNLIVGLVQGLLNSMTQVEGQGPEIARALYSGLIKGIPIILKGSADITQAFIEAIMTTDWIQVGKDMLRGIWEGFKEGFAYLGEFFSMDNIKAWFTGKEVKLPSFASGGIVSQPTLAMVGDNKRSPEAITPLHELYGIVKSAMEDGLRQGGGGLNQQTTQITLNVEGEKITEWVLGDNSVFGRRQRSLNSV